jgi:hypothetical protein
MIGAGRGLIWIGLFFLLVGGAAYLAGRAGILLFRLPGDIQYEGENYTCIIPIVSMILLSIVLSVVLNVVLRIMNR